MVEDLKLENPIVKLGAQDNAPNLVIGYPLDHSLSPRLHSRAYRDLGLNRTMVALPEKDVRSCIALIRRLSIPLCAVTMPHKQRIMEHLDDVDDLAQAIGAVNTVLNQDSKLVGTNTDYTGIGYALRNFPLSGKRVLILGAGGAARPLAYYLSQAGAQSFCTNRDMSKAEQLMTEFGGEAIQREHVQTLAPELIVNTTPLGMTPYKKHAPLKAHEIPPEATVFDFIYSPRDTVLIQQARERGAHVIPGIDLFVAQGLEQVRLWTRRQLEVSDYIDLLDDNMDLGRV